jgi:hypothetical protein
LAYWYRLAPGGHSSKAMNDIASNNPLNIHDPFRGKQMLAAIYMRLEKNALLFYFSLAG